MASKKNIPEIRFKGFDGEWEEKELDSIALFSKGHGYSKNDLVKNGTPIILYGRLYTQYQTVITEVDTYVTAKKNSVYSKGNEVVIPASGETAEDISRAAAVIHPAILIGSDLNIITPSKELKSIFLALSVSNGRSQREISKRAQGKSIVHLHNSDFRDVSIIYPTTKEQSQIGTFFQNLDALITQRQKKLEKLSSLKKAMLEKMFPRDGADEPELRFKGFTGKWERKKMGEILDISSAARVHKEEWKESGIPFFRSSDVVAAYKGEPNSKAFISKDLYHQLIETSGCVHKGDILITGGGSIGIPYLVTNDNSLYFKDADLLWLKKNSEMISHYLFFFLTTSPFKTYIKSITHIGTISHYTIEQAKATPIQFPSSAEQTQIASYFQHLDSLISLQKRELDKLRNMKKACLQKMFV